MKINIKNKLIKKQIIAVAVISYNAEDTILEILDSVLEQSYGPENIEFIISDDGSSDDTCQIVSNWLMQFKNRFYSCNFLSCEQNQGVVLNINSAWRAVVSSGWVKTIAADDILDIECLERLSGYVASHSDCKILFSDVYRFHKAKADAFKSHRYESDFYTLPAREQYQRLLIQNYIFAPTSFINLELLKSLDYADERFPMIEDLPLWLKITKLGVKLHGINQCTVYYRLADSVSCNLTKITNINYLQSKVDMYKVLIWPELDVKYYFHAWDKRLELSILQIGFHFFCNRKSKTYIIFAKVFMLFSPLYLYKKFFPRIQQKK